MLSFPNGAAHRRLLREDKKALALLALKRKKHQGELITQAEEQLLQVNTLISNVEMVSMQAELVKALASGNQALKTLQAEVSVDYVAQLMDENSELQSQVTEIGRMLSNTQSEDPDLFEEYQRLEAQVALDKISEVPNAPSTAMPEVLTSIATEADNLTSRQEIVTSVASDVDDEPVALAEA